MKQAYYDASVSFDTNNDLKSICLGYDYTAEHEFGIKEIKEAFGISDFEDYKTNFLKTIKEKLIGRKVKLGIDSRMITKLPDNFLYGEFSFTQNKKRYKVFYVGCFSAYKIGDRIENFMKDQIDFEKPFSAWWDEKEFLIASVDSKIPNQLLKAFMSHDAALFLSGSNNPFAGNGLTIAIKSKIESGVLSKIKNDDQERLKLIQTSLDTGIVKKISNSNKNYFALNPSWKKDISKISNTKYEVVFWLNPMEQNIYNYGWYTVEELEQWVNNDGPILKKN